jgi:osmotically inducible protein OsmC
MTQLEKQGTATQSAKVLYTAKTTPPAAAKNGVSRSSDGRLDIKLSIPGTPGGRH